METPLDPVLPTWLVRYMTADFPYTMELQCFFMAVQGCVKVRQGPNAKGTMPWFHAFCMSVLVGYGGGLLTPLWMGKPTGLLANDVMLGSCIAAFILVNVMPLGYSIFSSFPVVLVTTCFAELFRVTGVVGFSNTAFQAFKDSPSRYYPTPVFGPTVYPTILGNMGPFFVNGFHGYLKDGMPWNFQKGLLCSSFYHFFVNDQKGVIGQSLRHAISTYVPWIRMGMDDDRTFAMVMIGLFMHAMAILQLPYFLGPAFNPINTARSVGEFYLLPAVAPSTSSKAVALTPAQQQMSKKAKKAAKTKKSN